MNNNPFLNQHEKEQEKRKKAMNTARLIGEQTDVISGSKDN